MTFTSKPFQSPAPHISRADVPLSTLEQQVRETVARQREQRAEASAQRLRDLLAPSVDPQVGQNPTGRPRRSSAPSRRKHARRTTTNSQETP